MQNVQQWIEAVAPWAGLVTAAAASTFLMWLRVKRAKLRELRKRYPPTTPPPDKSH